MITTNNRTETLILLNSSCAELMETPTNRIYRTSKGKLFLTQGNMTVSTILLFPIEIRHLERLDTLMINALNIYSRL